MSDFQTITHLIPDFGGRVEDPPASNADQNKVDEIFKNILGQSAHFIQPILFRSGRLNVYADAAIWGQHIQHRNERLMVLLKAAGLNVNEIKVKIHPTTQTSIENQSHRTSSYNAKAASAHLEQFAAQLGENDLGKTVSRLAKRIRTNHSENKK